MSWEMSWTPPNVNAHMPTEGVPMSCFGILIIKYMLTVNAINIESQSPPLLTVRLDFEVNPKSWNIFSDYCALYPQSD